MPLSLDRQRTATMAARFAEAADLVASEFGGLDLHQQYRNAFARVLKWDPLGRVAMLGTDQRDLFVPPVRRAMAGALRNGGHLFDVGCGDGQSFALLADAAPDDTIVSFADPDPGYVAAYRAMLDGTERLEIGSGTVSGLDEMDAARRLPPDGSVDVVLALHMLYFVADAGAALTRLARLLDPGGVLVVVVADEVAGYGARAFARHAETHGADPVVAAQGAAMAARSALFGEDGRNLRRHLGSDMEVTLTRQASRLYGHSLSDLVALANIANLAAIEGTEKFAAPLALLHETPEAADLRIEDGGPRKGMLSVTQPQFVVVARKLR